jgi:tetratricopeptide (TPR) repeat protein
MVAKIMSKNTKDSSCEVSFFSSFGFLLGAIAILFLSLKLMEPDPVLTFGPMGLPSEAGSQIIASSVPVPNTAKNNLRSWAGSGSTFASGRGGTANEDSAARYHVEPSGDGDSAGAGQGQGNADTQKLIASAISLIDGGEPYKAMSILEKILAEDPKNEQALIELAMIHQIDLHDSQSALPLMEKAFQLNPDNKIVMAELLNMYDETKQSDTGLNFFLNSYDENPTPTGAMAIGQMYLDQNRLTDAKGYWEKAAETASGEQSEIAYNTLGELYQRTGEPDKALSSLQIAADKAEQKYKSGFFANDDELGKEAVAESQLNVVRLLLSQGRKAEAEEIMAKKLQGYQGGLAEVIRNSEKSNMLYGYK